MNSGQQNVLSTFQRAQAWLAARFDLTGIKTSAGTGVNTSAISSNPAGSATPVTAIGEQFFLLDAAVRDAEYQASAHDGFNRSILGLGSEGKALRTELISDQMVHVATIARAAIPDVVRMTEAFRVPRVSRKTGSLLAAAESMAKAGEQYKDKLVAGGLSADFPEQLRAAAAALKDVVDARGTSVANRVGASTAFHEALARGRKAVDTLTVMLKRQLKGDPATMAEWMNLRRIPKVGVRTAATPATVPATSPATTPAATASAPAHQAA